MSKSYGDVSFKAPLIIGFCTIILMLGGMTAWAVRAELDGAVVAQGRIIVDRNRQAVQHPVGGVVETIHVNEGDTVAKDDLLVSLDPTLTRSELTIVEGQLYELMARRGRLEAERDEAEEVVFPDELLQAADHSAEVASLVAGQKRLFQARLDSLEKSATQLRNQQTQLLNQIDGIDAQSDALERQLVLISQEADTQAQLLESGLTQVSRLLRLQREDAQLSGTKGELIARRASALERISELEIQELRLHASRREQAITVLRDLQYNELEMAERRRSLITTLERMDIRAPISGVVYDLRLLGARSVIRPAEPLLFIVPQDKSLVIEARVDPTNVTDVFVGQDVVVRFSAFDMRDTPDLFGRVIQLSPDSFEDPTTGRAYFRAEIVLPKEELAKLTPEQVLIPGMLADTFIRTGEQSALTYLTSPLTRYFMTAMRE